MASEVIDPRLLKRAIDDGDEAIVVALHHRGMDYDEAAHVAMETAIRSYVAALAKQAQEGVK
jgi:choline kinase